MLCFGQSAFFRFNHPEEAFRLKSMMPERGQTASVKNWAHTGNAISHRRTHLNCGMNYPTLTTTHSKTCCPGCHLCGKYIPVEPQKFIFVLSEITIQKSICDITHSVVYKCLFMYILCLKNKQTSSIPCVSAIRNRCTFTNGPFMQIWSYRVLPHA